MLVFVSQQTKNSEIDEILGLDLFYEYFMFTFTSTLKNQKHRLYGFFKYLMYNISITIK